MFLFSLLVSEEHNPRHKRSLVLPMSFMLSCSSKRRFSIFRSLQDKEKTLSMPVNHTYLHEITYPGHTMGKKRRKEGEPSALPCHRQTAPPVRVMLADLSGSIVFLKSSSFINPVIQLSAKAIPVWLKFSSQALSQKKKKNWSSWESH